jgi:hypothetical protein
MMNSSLSAKPNGSRSQRTKRHLAEARRTAFNRLEDGRRQAKAVLAHVRETRHANAPRISRTKRWVLDRVATVVAWKIDRDTYRRQFARLEAMRLGIDEWLHVMTAR